MVFVPAWLLAQTFLIPDPNQPALNPVGIASVTIPNPAELLWEIRFTEILGSPDFIPVVQALADPAVPVAARFAPVPWPPVNPTNLARVWLVGADLFTPLPSAGFVGGIMFALFRKPPV